MSKSYLMGLDAGSGGGRCLLVEIESGQVTATFRRWRPRQAPGTGGWGFALDTAAWWNLLAEAAREAMARAGAARDRVLGVAATSMRHGIVILDRDGHELLAVPNRDARACSEEMELAAQYGQEFYQRTGHWPSPVFAAARLRWLTTNAPEEWERIDALLSISDWLAYRLCAEMAADPSQAGETALFDLRTRDWAWKLIERLGFPRYIFPPVREPGSRLGSLTPEAADTLGLRAGAPVAMGGAGTQCALLGLGTLRPGEVALIAGTTAPIQMVVDRPMLDPNRRLWTGHHVVPGLWVLESNAGATGEVLEWFAQSLCPEAVNPVVELVTEAAQSSPGAAGLFSTAGATVMNASRMALPVANLTLTHLAAADDPAKRRHLARAILEGMAYGLRANIEQLLAVTEVEQPTLRLAGGMSRSSAWTQLVSDVLGTPVSVSATPEASALGAAICAGVGAGVFRNLTEGAQALVRFGRQHAPDPEAVRVYQELYAGWQALRNAQSQADEVAARLCLQALMSAHAAEPEPAVAPVKAPASPSFRPRVLVTAELDQDSLTALRTLADVEYAGYRQAMRMLTGPELVEALAGYHVFVTEIDVVDAEALKGLPDLRVIVACRGRPVNVEVDACTALGIPVIYTPGRNADAVADLTVAFMLMLARKVPEAAASLRQPGGEAGDMARMAQAHQRFQGHELWGQTVGLVGLGAVGRAVARRLRPFGARVLAYDPFVQPEEAARVGAEPVPLEQLLAESDFVSLHAAVTDETRGLIGAAELARMKPGAFLINTARAALVDEEALAESLRSGHLGGAALDVFSVEPPGADHPLLALPNVIATPHIGGNTFEVPAHQGRMVVEELTRLLRGRRPRHVLNPETLPRFCWEGPRRPVAPEALEKLGERPSPAVSDLEQAARPTPQPRETAAPQPAESRAVTLIEAGLAGLRRLGERLARKPAPIPQQEEPAGGPQIQRVLRAFIARAVADPALADFAQGNQVITHYVLTDLGLEFYLAFRDGQVTGDLGPPPEPAQVQLKMKAAVLDGMFTGRINAPRAAMTGKLSFRGDTRLAMGLQRIQKDLTRLYKEAREEAGGPGDLTAVEGAPAVEPKPVARPNEAAEDLRQEIVGVVSELYQIGLITATGGNISARVPDTDQVWITPSQLFKGGLRPEQLVPINLDGQVLDPDALAPSSEWLMHCAIYRARPDVAAVIHAHAPRATILGLTGLPFAPISTEAALLGDLPRVPFIMPGTRELADAAVEALGNHSAVLLQNHGLVVAAGSLRRAADLAEIIERTAELILGCYAVGKEPPTLPNDVVTMLREMGKLMG